MTGRACRLRSPTSKASRRKIISGGNLPDQASALKAKGKPAYNPDGGHPNDGGQTIIATIVHASLVNRAAKTSN
ncbi:MAG: hypothetical protein WCJ66_14560 [Verrucomicrobiota bacterium]